MSEAITEDVLPSVLPSLGLFFGGHQQLCFEDTQVSALKRHLGPPAQCECALLKADLQPQSSLRTTSPWLTL